MSDTIYIENRKNTGRWNCWDYPETEKQHKKAWTTFLLQGSNPFDLEYYLTVKYKKKQSHDDLRGKINPLLKRFITRNFGFRRLTPNIPMKFIFFIEEGRFSEGFHTHCVFSVPTMLSGENLNPSDFQFIKREIEVTRKVNKAFNRLTYFPMYSLTRQIDREMNKRERITGTPKSLTEDEYREMVLKSKKEIFLVSSSKLKRIYSLKGLVAEYHQKDFWKNKDCYDERSSDFAFV